MSPSVSGLPWPLMPHQVRNWSLVTWQRWSRFKAFEYTFDLNYLFSSSRSAVCLLSCNRSRWSKGRRLILRSEFKPAIPFGPRILFDSCLDRHFQIALKTNDYYNSTHDFNDVLVKWLWHLLAVGLANCTKPSPLCKVRTPADLSRCHRVGLCLRPGWKTQVGT